jgi:DNA-binding transcriptional ArsR family regulator
MSKFEPSDDALASACEVLRVLTHPDRLRICRRLLTSPATVSTLIQDLALRQSVVSQHLNLLYARQIVDRERDGRSVTYRVVHPGPKWLLECIAGRYGPQAESGHRATGIRT